MATQNSTWGYTRIQGALKNLGHRVARSTIAALLKAEGIPPSRQGPTTWRTFFARIGRALVAADFSPRRCAARGLVTYDTMFVIELQSRRVRVAGSTRFPDEAFVAQAVRDLANAIDGVLADGCVLICDRDRKWSRGVVEVLEQARPDHAHAVPRTDCNAFAERFVRSIKEECLDRVSPLGERHLRRTSAEFVAHYHGERNHQRHRQRIQFSRRTNAKSCSS